MTIAIERIRCGPSSHGFGVSLPLIRQALYCDDQTKYLLEVGLTATDAAWSLGGALVLWLNAGEQFGGLTSGALGLDDFDCLPEYFFSASELTMPGIAFFEVLVRRRGRQL
jgi:hypothetical protein